MSYLINRIPIKLTENGDREVREKLNERVIRRTVLAMHINETKIKKSHNHSQSFNWIKKLSRIKM